MAQIKLTKRALDSISPRAKPYIIYDADLKGFGLRVMPSGARSWVVEYRPGAGGRNVAKKRLSLGAATKLTPDQARSLARDHLADARRGLDPAAARQAERDTPTLKMVVDDYLVDIDGRKAPGTVRMYRTYLIGHVVPELGAAKITAVKAADVAKLHRSIGRDHPIAANRVASAVSALFGFAAKRGVVPFDFNPARGVEKFKEEGRERYLGADELQRLGTALREAETTSPFATAAIRLLLFTGCRLREILDLEWSHVDFDRGCLFLPKSKTGRKTIVLNAPALEILSTLPKISPFVVPGAQANRPRADLAKPWAAMTRLAGLEGLRLHDLRHSFASFAAGASLGLPIIGKLLGHTQASTTARYAHLADDPLRRATNTIGATIAAAMDKKPAGDVVKLKGGRRDG